MFAEFTEDVGNLAEVDEAVADADLSDDLDSRHVAERFNGDDTFREFCTTILNRGGVVLELAPDFFGVRRCGIY